MTSRHRSRTDRQGRPAAPPPATPPQGTPTPGTPGRGVPPQGTVCFAASPVFGHLTPPDGTEDTVEQEVLNLFAEPPGPSTAALPPTRTAGGGGGGWAGAGKGLPRPARPPRDRRDRRARYGRITGLLVCVAAVGAGSLTVLYGLSDPRAADRLVTVDGPRVVAPVPSAAGTSEAPAPEPTPTASASPSPSPAPSAVRTRRPGTPPAAPGTATPVPAAPPAAPPPPPASVPAPTPPPPAPRPDTPPLLTLGSTGPEVADLQRRLEQLHLYHGAYDGEYDQALAEAVHRFQWIRRIDEPAGVYGPATRAALLAETGPARRRA